MGAYRILSLDGGGSWALIEVKALIKLFGEETTGRQVLSNFDLVAANSGGSIVLGCLIEDMPLREILAFFNDPAQRKAAFSKTSSWGDRILNAILHIGPRYSADHKLTALQAVLKNVGSRLLPDAVAGIPSFSGGGPVHVLITAFDYDANRATFFRSARFTRPGWGVSNAADVTVAEAVHASTNAPVNYFDGPATFPGRSDRYWDGAISGCNNPVLAAVTEAIGLGQSPTCIVALSMGTGAVTLPSPGAVPSKYTQPRSKTGLKNDLPKLAESILDDPPDVASFLAHVMTGVGEGLPDSAPQSRIVRMSPLVAPFASPAGSGDPWMPPQGMSPDQFNALVNLDMDAVEQAQVDEIKVFADLWIADQVRNQPIRMNGGTLQCQLGQETFAKAEAAWEALSGLACSERAAQADIAEELRV